MSSSDTFNADIVPRPPCAYGIHPGTALEEDISKIMQAFGIRRVPPEVVMTEHQVFDVLQFPQYSPVRTQKNVVYVSGEHGHKQHPIEHDDAISHLHEQRFGYARDSEKAKRLMLCSHTTAILIKNLMSNIEPIYTISKTYRNKKERREKTHAEIVLVDHSLPEVISFMQTIYSYLLQRVVELGVTADFYYFCEPSFSFSMPQGSGSVPMGSGGYVREELLQLLSKHSSVKPNAVALVVLPYQKILNMRIGKKPFDYTVDYNAI
jgi:phenylalanyl-tRNA synthetase alpha subunit